MQPLFIRKILILMTLLLTFTVILIGAYTRLMDAGLGCPDWPGCYGLWRAPANYSEVIQAQNAFPLSPIDYVKAHTEMIHRYFATTLGLFILIITGITLFSKNSSITRTQKILAIGLTALVIFQGLLGMWTVTLKLLPVIVMSHLLAGLLLLSLLFCFWMMQGSGARTHIYVSKNTKRLAILTLIVVSIQIALGGWTSTNYAALSCPDFPLCQTQWWPKMSLQAFNLLGAFHLENPLSYMTLEARTGIHMAHRIGALITSLIILLLIRALWQTQRQMTCYFIMLIALLLMIQVSLGITNVVALLPLPIAVAHNGIATLLLLSIITLLFYLKTEPRAS